MVIRAAPGMRRKNGEHLGTAFRNVVASALVPTIGLHRSVGVVSPPRGIAA